MPSNYESDQKLRPDTMKECTFNPPHGDPAFDHLPIHTSRCQRIARFWNEVISDFLGGVSSQCRSPLDSWFASYFGSKDGVKRDDVFPEPYMGRIDGKPRMVFLALNPGQAFPSFQSRSGVFAAEIHQLGSYQAWAATWPYLRDPWNSQIGMNRFHRSRLTFMRRWYEDKTLSEDHMLTFELFPWHSKRLTASIRPDPAIITEFIWEPIADSGAPYVFAFGADWFSILPRLEGFEVIDSLGFGGRPFPTKVKPGARKAIMIGRTPSGTTVIAEKHSGGATPPSETETALLRAEIRRLNL
jgi:hypothetical protein